MSEKVRFQEIREELYLASASVRRQQQYRALVETAILRTVAYGDVFDYPLRRSELHRYLVGVRAIPYTIENLLQESRVLADCLSIMDETICLRGREALREVRRQRAAQAARLWPKARRYGRLLGRLPFIRMVAVTGSLAVDNPQVGGDDIDYLLVTAAGRVWLGRALAILGVRWAALQGDRICPNYVLSENALASLDRDLYNAYEYTQMVPLTGMRTYARLRQLNAWTDQWLPNAGGFPPATLSRGIDLPSSNLKNALEDMLSGWRGDRLERWEMNRKVSRFAQIDPENQEANFCADRCKGHFNRHAERTAKAYQSKLVELGLA